MGDESDDSAEAKESGESAGSTTSSASVTEVTRRRTATAWLQAKNGKRPWAARRLLPLGLIGGAVAVLGSTLWAVPHIQGKLEDATLADLRRAGIETSGLVVDYDYRSGEIRGVLPPGVSVEDVRAAVDHDGIRSLKVLATPSAEPASDDDAGDADGEADGDADTEVAEAETGSTDVVAELENGTLTLSGTVLSEAQRDTLVAAAGDAVGVDNVIDELEVSGLDPTVDGADARIDALAAVLGASSDATSLTATLSDTDLAVSGEVPDQDAADSLTAAVDASGTDAGLDATTDLAVPDIEATGPTEVTATLEDGVLTLTGTVLSEAQRDDLVSAAAEAVGADNVVDELEISGLAEATPGADDRIADLASVLSAFSGLGSGTAELTDAALGVTGTAAGADASAALIDAVDGVTSVETELALDEADVDTQVASLQDELDGLAAEIRETVVFPTGSTVLSAEARATLDQVVAAMDRYQLPVVEVSGHTDDVGSAASNLALSQRRAESVANYLIFSGVPVERISARGAGEEEPLASNDTADGRAANRRVELTALAEF
ncbi:MAG: OmpA family protein [Acidimicrobiales bacterium]|nr:OmpA family protein [Acidimicrobiales bacterium]